MICPRKDDKPNDHVADAEAAVDEALNALARLEHGDPRLEEAEEWFGMTQRAVRAARERWLGD